MSHYPNYQIMLPGVIRFDKRLPPNAKLLYGEIKALCDQQGYCWASNNHLAKLYGVQAKVISRWISLLNRFGYVKIEVHRGNQRKIYVNSDPLQKGSTLPSTVEQRNSIVEGDLSKSRSEEHLHLINNIIDYNYRLYNRKDHDSSTKKWRGDKKPEGKDIGSKKPETSPRVVPVPPPQKFVKPTTEEVEYYMKKQKALCPKIEITRLHALKFVSHYQANGWKVGHHSMQDWKAAVDKWLLNAANYQLQKQQNHENRLHSGGAKDYSIPL